METKFQTSFIPKRPMQGMAGGLAPQAQRVAHGGASIFMTIAVVIFVASVASIGAVYGWKQYLLGAQTGYSSSLAQREKEFNLDQISLMKAQASKIILARQLISNHIAVSKIFSVISQLTSENVRFLTMDLTVPAGTPGPFQMSLSGYGRSFPSVAFQSDVLNQLDKYGLRTVVKNAIVSNPVLNHNGTVSFGFTAQIDPSTFAYSKNLAAPSSQSPAQSAPVNGSNQ